MKAERAGIVNDSKKPQKKRVTPRSAALSWTNGNRTATMKRAEKRKPVTRSGRAFPFRTLSVSSGGAFVVLWLVSLGELLVDLLNLRPEPFDARVAGLQCIRQERIVDRAGS